MSLRVGDKLEPLCVGPISRHTLALYCAASGDHNPLHVDSDFAKADGFPDVICHGMVSMAFLGRLIVNAAPIERLRSFSVRFAAITHVHDTVTCEGRVLEHLIVAGEERRRLELTARTQAGAVTLVGEAIVAV